MIENQLKEKIKKNTNDLIQNHTLFRYGESNRFKNHVSLLEKDSVICNIAE